MSDNMKELDERDYEDSTHGWLDAGEPAKALECCTEGIRYYPDSHWLHRLAAVACEYLRRYDDAVVYLTEAIRLDPEAAGAYEYRASINRDAGNYAASINRGLYFGNQNCPSSPALFPSCLCSPASQ